MSTVSTRNMCESSRADGTMPACREPGSECLAEGSKSGNEDSVQSDDFEELDELEADVQALVDHLDRLISGAEFLKRCHSELTCFQGRLDSLETMSISIPVEKDGLDANFMRGTLWIGAVAAYEGLLHKILLHAMAVDSLQQQITEHCQRLLTKAKPPQRLKDATEKSIRKWLTERTISDPEKIAEDLVDIFGVEPVRLDAAFCKRLLEVRNLFTHRGGGAAISIEELLQVLETLGTFGAEITTIIVNQMRIEHPDSLTSHRPVNP